MNNVHFKKNTHGKDGSFLKKNFFFITYSFIMALRPAMSEIKGNNLPRIKVTNQALIREAIYKFGPISRLDITKLLDLTFPTITTNISLMLEDGLLVEKCDDSSSSGRGRKTMLVDINPKSRLFMGIEMRRHASYAVIVDLKGNLISQKSVKRFHDDYEGSLEEACSLALVLLEESGMTWNDITGLGFCLPGIVDSKNGVLAIHPRFKWKGRNTKEDVRRATGYNGLITVVNNTCARVYGASLFNSSVFMGADHAAYMYAGTGIKCPLVFSLKNHFGSIVGEGEVGHMVVNVSGPLCECGNHGCLESYASENAILREADRMAVEHKSPLLSSLYSDHRLEIKDVLYGMDMGDRECIRIVTEALDYLSLAIANVNNFVKPDCVVVECKLFEREENKKIFEMALKRNLSWNSILDYNLSYVKCDEFNGALGSSAAAIRENLQLFME